MGHAVPMPVVVRTRAYDETFYASVLSNGHVVDTASVRKGLGGGGKKRV